VLGLSGGPVPNLLYSLTGESISDPIGAVVNDRITQPVFCLAYDARRIPLSQRRHDNDQLPDRTRHFLMPFGALGTVEASRRRP
jgi:hypothetical protein